jgi:serine/threonine protein kinase
MGAVYAAEDEKLSRRVALKVLDAPDANAELTSRLMREARILAQLEHPGIAPVHDVGALPDGRVYYTMKLVQGLRLDKYIVQLESLSQRLRLFLRVCDAVAFAHARGVLHRDLKPANIMVGSFGEVLVMDWGLAKILQEHGLALDETVLISSRKAESENDSTQSTVITGHGTVLGTPGYMSPEQASGETEQIDVRSDIFSLGALLKFIAAGGGQRKSPVPRSVLAICAKATAERPNARYADVSELAADVSLYMDGLPVGAYSENFLERFGRFYKRHQIAILLITAYLITRALVLFFFRR